MDRLLVDGTHLLFRAYHTTGGLTFPDGSPSGAAWGALRSLLMLASKTRTAENPSFDGASVCFDGGRSRRRLKIFPAYKAHRNQRVPPEERERRRAELASQEAILRALLPLAGCDVHKAPGVEADDIIGVLAEAHGPAGGAVVCSGDGDFAQLVGRLAGVRLLKPDAERVSPKPARPTEFGEGFLAMRALAGDASDNISGVPGIGPARAAALVNWLNEPEPMKGPEELPWRLKAKAAEEPAERNVRAALKAFRADPEALRTYERNLVLMDLWRSSHWPEVLDAAENPESEARPDPAEFARQVGALGWGKSIGTLSSAIRVFAPRIRRRRSLK